MNGGTAPLPEEISTSSPYPLGPRMKIIRLVYTTVSSLASTGLLAVLSDRNERLGTLLVLHARKNPHVWSLGRIVDLVLRIITSTAVFIPLG